MNTNNNIIDKHLLCNTDSKVLIFILDLPPISINPFAHIASEDVQTLKLHSI